MLFNSFMTEAVSYRNQSIDFNYRSSYQEVFYEKGILKNYAKFIGKDCFWVPCLMKLLAGGCNIIKKKTLTQVLSCYVCESFKNTCNPDHHDLELYKVLVQVPFATRKAELDI